MNKKTKSTSDIFIESLTPQQKKKFDEEYQDLLLSEMILAAMQQDDVSIRKLAKLAGVSPTIIQSMRSGTRKNFSIETFFKVLKGLGCRVVIERKGHHFSLDLSHLNKR